MGVKVEIEQTEDEVFEIMASNRQTFLAWLSVETQWRVAATMAGLLWVGLDYCAVEFVLKHLEAPAAVFSELQLMELEALPILNGGA